MATPLTRISIVVFTIMGVAMLDTCMMAWSNPKEHFRIIAGQQDNISGKTLQPVDPAVLKARFQIEGDQLPNDVWDKVLAYAPHHPGLRIHFLNAKGRLWRGVLDADPHVMEGDYPVRVFRVGDKLDEAGDPFLIRVFRDETGYRKSFWSLGKRFFGVDPWWIVLGILPVAAGCLVMVMRQTAREDAALQAAGIGPIYKLVKRKTHWELLFGLGSVHGVRPGDRLAVMGPDRKIRGVIEAKDVADESAGGDLPLDADIAPNYLIGTKVPSEPADR